MYFSTYTTSFEHEHVKVQSSSTYARAGSGVTWVSRESCVQGRVQAVLGLGSNQS